MALLKYFSRINGQSFTPLPNPESSLNQVVYQKVIEAANVETFGRERERCKTAITISQGNTCTKALVGKYGAEHGVMNSIRHFDKDLYLGKHRSWLER